MPRFGMVIDTRKCVGCMDCVVACQTENDVPQGFCRDWIATEVRGTFPALRMEIRSERCNHCDNPPCVSCCPTGASHVEDFGKTVQVTANKCIGCKACCRQVHLLHSPRQRRPRSGLRLGLSDPLHALRRPGRSEERDQPVAAHARPPHAASGRRHTAASVLPRMRGD